jgi:tetratricopeptide (TPR) repeat protein
VGRRERDLPAAGPLADFAHALREVRREAGEPSYRRLAQAAHFSAATLARAADGRALPSLEVTLAYVGACRGDVAEWRQRWQAVDRLLRPAPESGRRPVPAAGPAMPIPMQLPPAAGGFVGRREQLIRLEAMLSGDRPPGSPALAVVVGSAGAGKTALVVHWAHGIRRRFPDGVLFADLRGFAPAQAPVDTAAQLESFLRALGVAPAEIPFGQDERSALLRGLLDGRRLLMVLDNVADSQQVRPLLAGSGETAIVVTSRSSLGSLVSREGAVRLMVEPMVPQEAQRLLRRHLPATRRRAPAGAVATLVELCAGLPLALRVAAERVAADPSNRLAEVISLLARERNRLDLLSGEDEYDTVRAVFSWSYRSLTGTEQRMFRLLGVDPGVEASVPAAAALVGIPVHEARATLDRLAGMHLLETPGAARHRMHDLMRLYAREQALVEEPEAARRAAIHRSLCWYLHTADAAGRLLVPKRRGLELGAAPPGCEPLTFGDYDEALAWCDRELVNLVAATRAAIGADEYAIAWRLPAALSGFFTIRRHWAEWIDTHQLGLQAAHLADDAEAQALLRSRLGVAYGYLRRFTEATEHFERAVALQESAGDRHAAAATLLNFGFVLWRMGRAEDATACFQRSLPVFRETGDRHGEGMALNNLGEAYAELENFPPALEHLEQALVVFRASENRYGQGSTLDSLGMTYRRMGRPDDALDWLGQARAVRADIGDRHGEARTLCNLAETLHDLGRLAEAQQCWRAALTTFEQLNDPQAEDVRGRLAEDPSLPST